MWLTMRDWYYGEKGLGSLDDLIEVLIQLFAVMLILEAMCMAICFGRCFCSGIDTRMCHGLGS